MFSFLTLLELCARAASLTNIPFAFDGQLVTSDRWLK